MRQKTADSRVASHRIADQEYLKDVGSTAHQRRNLAW